MSMNDALAALNLRHVIQAQALKLLERIRRGYSADDLW
jgi:hypothetical protein